MSGLAGDGDNSDQPHDVRDLPGVAALQYDVYADESPLGRMVVLSTGSDLVEGTSCNELLLGPEEALALADKLVAAVFHGEPSGPFVVRLAAWDGEQ